MSAGKKHGPMGGPMGRGPMAAGQKAKNFKGSFRKLAQYLAPFKWKILIVGIFAIASTVFAIIGPNILKDATNELVRGITATITGAGDGIDFGLIGFIVLIKTNVLGGMISLTTQQGWAVFVSCMLIAIVGLISAIY